MNKGYCLFIIIVSMTVNFVSMPVTKDRGCIAVSLQVNKSCSDSMVQPQMEWDRSRNVYNLDLV